MQSTISFTVRTKLLVLAMAALAFCITWAYTTYPAAGINYSAGTYGSCTYDTCSITLTTSGSISANITPSSGATTCTVASDSVTATTDSSTGYTVTLTDSDTSNTLSGPSSIAANSSTSSSPTILSANTWGYRVDGIDGFGAGPTTATSNDTIPTTTFAGVPISTGTPALIRTTSTADTGSVSTPVWYGVCVDSSLQSGSYSDSVTYTAIIN